MNAANNITGKNTKAIDAFIARKTEIDAMLERLRALSDDHFNVAPDQGCSTLTT